MRPAAPDSLVSCHTRSENLSTARSCRRLRTKSTIKPTARTAEVNNHGTKDDKINSDLDNDGPQRRLLLETLSGWTRRESS